MKTTLAYVHLEDERERKQEDNLVERNSRYKQNAGIKYSIRVTYVKPDIVNFI